MKRVSVADLLRAELAKAAKAKAEDGDPTKPEAPAVERAIHVRPHPAAKTNPVPLNGAGVLRAALAGGPGTINRA